MTASAQRPRKGRIHCDKHGVDLTVDNGVQITKAGHRWCAKCKADQVEAIHEGSRARWREYRQQQRNEPQLCERNHERTFKESTGRWRCDVCHRERALISYYRRNRPDRLPNGVMPDADFDDVVVDRLISGAGFDGVRALCTGRSGGSRRRGPTWAEILLAADRIERKRNGGKPLTDRRQKLRPAELAELIRVEEWKVREARQWASRTKWTPETAEQYI